MQKRVCELFAGVGAFRLGFGPAYSTVWYQDWDPSCKHIPYSHGCYLKHFGLCLDQEGRDQTHLPLSSVQMEVLPDFDVLTGSLPWLDLFGSQGAWTSVERLLKAKHPSFLLFENIERLLVSPSKYNGQDFLRILRSLSALGYGVEWQAVNAADYGFPQRRKRLFLFGFRLDTGYGQHACQTFLESDGLDYFFEGLSFFADRFPLDHDSCNVLRFSLSESAELACPKGFANQGFCLGNQVCMLEGRGDSRFIKRFGCLGDVLEKRILPESYFVPYDQLYYTDMSVVSADERTERLPKTARRSWQYVKGGKRITRYHKDGSSWIYTEGAVPLLDVWERPSRTLLPSEGTFSRSTHLVRDPYSGRIRILTPVETERLNGFPDDWTKEYLRDGIVCSVPEQKRRSLMGKASVVGVIQSLAKALSQVIDQED